jgi:hypothetical protein
MRLPELCLIQERHLTLGRVALERFGGALGGRLLLVRGFAGVGIADAVAGLVAGTAVLCVDGNVEHDPGLLREGLRAGLCDFVVAHLDEALRILKNELRQKRAVCVGLNAGAAACLAEMAERGVQPDLLAQSGADDGLQVFAERGAVTLPVVESWASLLPCGVSWTVQQERVRTMPLLARLAAESLEREGPETAARAQWLEASPRVLGRAFGGGQCLRMTQAEAKRFAARAADEVPQAAVTSRCDSE